MHPERSAEPNRTDLDRVTPLRVSKRWSPETTLWLLAKDTARGRSVISSAHSRAKLGALHAVPRGEWISATESFSGMGCRQTASGSSIQKVLPSPTSLLTPRAPPISSASCREVANPSPAPRTIPCCSAPRRSKGVKSRSWSVGEIPGPVSCTHRWTRPPFTWLVCPLPTTARIQTCPPGELYWIALRSKWTRISCKAGGWGQQYGSGRSVVREMQADSKFGRECLDGRIGLRQCHRHWDGFRLRLRFHACCSDPV